MSIKKVYLEPTDRCNLRCEMCYRKTWEGAPVSYSLEMEKRIIAELRALPDLKEVVFGGIGEPTSYSGLPRMLTQLSDKKIILTSNMAQLSEVNKSAILNYVDQLVVSIDGGPETFEAIRHFPLEKVMDNLRSLMEEKKRLGSITPRIYVQMVISKRNLDEMRDVIDLGRSVGAEKIIVSHLLPIDMKDQDQILYTLYRNDELKDMFDRTRVYALRKGLNGHFPDYRIKTERHCRFIEGQSLMISAEGEVVPCYRFSHSGREVILGREKKLFQQSFGNVMQGELQAIYDKSTYKRFRQSVLNNQHASCLDCDLQQGCDMVRDSEMDCYGMSPSCGDCLWARNIVYCI
jgi:tungsten cofactor oxidoreducase radical SAM maturase